MNSLREYDLVRENQEIDADGNHYKTYETALKRASFEIEAGGYNIDLELRQSLANQFDAFWSELERSGAGDRPEPAPQTDRRSPNG